MAKNKTTIKGRLKRWKRNAIATVVVLAILYIGAHILSRTAGMRQAIADKISNGTRQQISLEKCGMTPLMGLRLQGLGFQGVVMPDVKLTFNQMAPVLNWFLPQAKEKPYVKELRIKDMEIRFRRIPTSGLWEPLVLNGVGNRLGAVLGLNPVQAAEGATLPKFPPYAINAKTLLQLDSAKLVWRDEKGREVAYITEADLRLDSGSFTKRKVRQTVVECGHIKLASGGALRDFRLEAFTVEGSQMVVVLDMTDSNGQYDEFASKTLWQDLNLHLTQLSRIE